MTSVLDLLFQYRLLLGKRDLERRLGWEDISAIEALEAAFSPRVALGVRDRNRRRFHRVGVTMRGRLRHKGIADLVDIRDLGPGGALVHGAPYACEHDAVELVIDRGGESFRYRGIVRWVCEDGIDYQLGIAFIGVPLRLRYVRPPPPPRAAA